MLLIYNDLICCGASIEAVEMGSSRVDYGSVERFLPAFVGVMAKKKGPAR